MCRRDGGSATAPCLSATSVVQVEDIEERLQYMVKSLDAVPPSTCSSQLANVVLR